MTIAFLRSTGADAGSVVGATGTTLTLTSTGAGDQGIVMARIGLVAPAPVLTDNGGSGGGTWNILSGYPLVDNTNVDTLYAFLCTNLKTATTLLTLKFTGTGTVRWAYHEYTVGASNILAVDKQQNFLNGAISGTGVTITSNATAATANANELLLGFFKSEGAQPNGAVTAGASYNLREQRSKLFTEDQIVSSTGTYTATWTTTATWVGEPANDTWAVIQTFFEQGVAGFPGGDDEGITHSFHTEW
jgi:hypothetical protein